MADTLSRPIAELAALMGEGKLKARMLAEEAIANHERFGAPLMAYSQWTPEHARKCADAADAAFALGMRAGPLQGIPDVHQGSLRRRRFPNPCRLAQASAAEVRDRRSRRRQSAATVADGDGQDAYGRICVRRHRARTPITAAPAIPGTSRRIAHLAAHRAEPASRSARAPRCSLSARTPRPRCVCRRR